MNANAPHFESDNGGGKLSSFDAALKIALHDVDVPDGLAERMIGRIEMEEASECSRGKMPVARGRVRLLSRRVLIAVGSLALVALVAISVIYVRQSPRQIVRE